MEGARVSAIFSPCRRYRYVLEKRWSDTPTLAVIGHNPSTAGQILCPGCGRRFGPSIGLEQKFPTCRDEWDRPGDGSDELLDPTARKCMVGRVGMDPA